MKNLNIYYKDEDHILCFMCAVRRTMRGTYIKGIETVVDNQSLMVSCADCHCNIVRESNNKKEGANTSYYEGYHKGYEKGFDNACESVVDQVQKLILR